MPKLGPRTITHLNSNKSEKVSQPLLIYFQRLTLEGPKTALEQHPPTKRP